MKVRIIEVATNKDIDALIRERLLKEMPSIHQNWNFNFNKHVRKLNCSGYVLVTDINPNVIEGCMIFEMIEKAIPSIAYLEIAPHNRKPQKRYENIAGCLIAYAFKLSLIKGKGYYKGLLFLDISEEKEEDQQKLMRMYSQKYNAKLYAGGTMVIMDEGGEELIKRYLDPTEL